MGKLLQLTELLTAREVGAQLHVSHETLERLKRYVEILLKWQRAINLISHRTVKDIWRRHILDCGQLKSQLPDTRGPMVDIGTGAGLPGLILSILGTPNVYLVESDARKCAFLREAIRVTECDAMVLNTRVEEVKGLAATVVTARAVAPLNKLIELSQFVSTPHSHLIFLKGKDFKYELTRLEKKWNMKLTVLPSLSSPEGVILKMESLVRVNAASDRN